MNPKEFETRLREAKTPEESAEVVREAAEFMELPESIVGPMLAQMIADEDGENIQV